MALFGVCGCEACFSSFFPHRLEPEGDECAVRARGSAVDSNDVSCSTAGTESVSTADGAGEDARA